MQKLNNYIYEKFIINKNSKINNLLSLFIDKYGEGKFVTIKELFNQLSVSTKFENWINEKYLSILNGDYKFLSINTSKNSNKLFLVNDENINNELYSDLQYEGRHVGYLNDYPYSTEIDLFYLKNNKFSCFVYKITKNNKQHNSKPVFIIQEYGS